MLRHKLLFILAILVLLMLGTALASVLLMQNVLRDMQHISDIAMLDTTATNKLRTTITVIEADLLAWQRSSDTNPGRLESSLKSLSNQIHQLQSFYHIQNLGSDPFQRLNQTLVTLKQHIASIKTATQETKITHINSAISEVRLMKQEILEHANFALDSMKREQHAVTKRFRWMVLGLTATFILLINVSIIFLLRAASFVLKPVDRLVEASRYLAREDYTHRVEISRQDEFDELANAFNNLAQQLQMNEQRKIETLHQVARTLSHELNNAISIIELQLSMVAKSSSLNQAGGKQLELIHETLQHMNKTVFSLTQVRRVVLTDYIKGVKMLDLKRSTEADTSTSTATTP